LKYARPVSVLFILISLSLFIILRMLSNEKTEGSFSGKKKIGK
jgi:ABC-type sulfate transport system permease component